MTKPLDPEIKVMRAVHRALSSVGLPEQRRILEWVVANRLNRGAFPIPAFPERTERS